MSEATQSEGLSPLAKAHQFYSEKVCAWLAVPNKFFKLLANGVSLVSLAAPLGRATKAAQALGRVRPLFYASLMVRDIPKLWKKEGIRKDLLGSEEKPESRDRANALFTVTFLAFQATYSAKGALDLLTQLRATKGLKRALEGVQRAIPALVMAVNSLAIYLTVRAIAQAEEKRKELSQNGFGLADDVSDTFGTAFEANWVEFPGELPLALALEALSGAFGTIAGVQKLIRMKNAEQKREALEESTTEPSA